LFLNEMQIIATSRRENDIIKCVVFIIDRFIW
jgi:hypothetical protein